MSAKPEPGSLALVVCGALVREVEAICRARGWRAQVFGVPARHHLHPDGITEAVDGLLTDFEGQFEKVLVIYGDCGTAGALDRVLDRHVVERPVGPHCYAMLGGPRLAETLAEAPDSYVLTDYLVRNWESTVLDGVAPPAREAFLARLFDGFARLVHVRQQPDLDLERRATEIATELGLPLETHDSGLRHLEEMLVDLVQGRPEDAGMEKRP